MVDRMRSCVSYINSSINHQVMSAELDDVGILMKESGARFAIVFQDFDDDQVSVHVKEKERLVEKKKKMDQVIAYIEEELARSVSNIESNSITVSELCVYLRYSFIDRPMRFLVTIPWLANQSAKARLTTKTATNQHRLLFPSRSYSRMRLSCH